MKWQTEVDILYDLATKAATNGEDTLAYHYYQALMINFINLICATYGKVITNQISDEVVRKLNNKADILRVTRR